MHSYLLIPFLSYFNTLFSFVSAFSLNSTYIHTYKHINVVYTYGRYSLLFLISIFIYPPRPIIFAYLLLSSSTMQCHPCSLANLYVSNLLCILPCLLIFLYRPRCVQHSLPFITLLKLGHIIKLLFSHIIIPHGNPSKYPV